MANEMNDPGSATSTAIEDGRIKAMLEAVTIPEGLNARIKSRIQTAALVDLSLRALAPVAPSNSVDETIQTNEQTPTSTVALPGQATWGDYTRRAVLILAIAASLTGLAYLANQWRQPHEREWLVKQSQTILENWEQDNPANLQSETNLADLPASVREQLARVTARGSRSLVALGSKYQGTLYRLDSADGRSLVLMRIKDLPLVRGMNSRFVSLQTPSGGWSLMALQVNNETFVLAAECTREQLMNYIRRPMVT